MARNSTYITSIIWRNLVVKKTLFVMWGYDVRNMVWIDQNIEAVDLIVVLMSGQRLKNWCNLANNTSIKSYSFWKIVRINTICSSTGYPVCWTPSESKNRFWRYQDDKVWVRRPYGGGGQTVQKQKTPPLAGRALTLSPRILRSPALVMFSVINDLQFRINFFRFH